MQKELISGEHIIDVADYPALSYFKPGDKDKKLVVFVPGGYNLARVAYGIPGSSESDFLAHWFHKKGHSFLGLSYPLDHGVFGEVCPEYSILDWAKQIVGSVKHELEKHHLPKSFIILGWSMAGKTVSQVNKLAKLQGLSLIYISLASSPPLNGLISSDFFDDLIKMPTSKGLSSKAPLIPWFLDQLHEQNELNGHMIMDDETYINATLGDHSIHLHATNMRFGNDTFIEDTAETLSDTNAMEYGSYPISGLICGTNRHDYINTLFNKFDWGPMLVRSIYNVLTRKMSLESLSSNEWDSFRQLIDSVPQQLFRQIEGSHLFFIGEKSAKQTVLQVESLLRVIDQLKNINTPDALCSFVKHL